MLPTQLLFYNFFNENKASISNYKKFPELEAPATPENILFSINKIKQQ